MTQPRIMQSGYMHWAKFKPPARFALTGSEVPHFRMDSLPVALEYLDLDGASHPRYAPLREAIANSPHLKDTMMLNGERCPLAEHGERVLVDGDEIYLLAPIAGG